MGAPPFAVFKGRESRTLNSGAVVPALGKLREEQGTPRVGPAGEIKSPGNPPTLTDENPRAF